MKQNKRELKDASVADLVRRKKVSREYLRSLSPLEKVEQLFALQDQYFQMLVIREKNSGPPVPEKWKKWYKARHPD